MSLQDVREEIWVRLGNNCKGLGWINCLPLGRAYHACLPCHLCNPEVVPGFLGFKVDDVPDSLPLIIRMQENLFGSLQTKVVSLANILIQRTPDLKLFWVAAG